MITTVIDSATIMTINCVSSGHGHSGHSVELTVVVLIVVGVVADPFEDGEEDVLVVVDSSLGDVVARIVVGGVAGAGLC